MKWLITLLRGLEAPPTLVGAARGVLEAAVLAGLAELFLVLPSILPQDSLWLAVGYAIIRVLEGKADDIDPAKKRA